MCPNGSTTVSAVAFRAGVHELSGHAYGFEDEEGELVQPNSSEKDVEEAAEDCSGVAGQNEESGGGAHWHRRAFVVAARVCATQNPVFQATEITNDKFLT